MATEDEKQEYYRRGVQSGLRGAILEIQKEQLGLVRIMAKNPDLRSVYFDISTRCEKAVRKLLTNETEATQ